MYTGRAVLSQRRTVLYRTLLEPRGSGTRASLVHNTDSTLFKNHPAQFFFWGEPCTLLVISKTVPITYLYHAVINSRRVWTHSTYTLMMYIIFIHAHIL